MHDFLVVVVPDEDRAFKCIEELRRLNEDATLTVFGTAVASRETDGRLSVKQRDIPPWGLGTGAVLGGLLGVLGGPVGAVVGLTAGSMLGGGGDSMRVDLSDEFLAALDKELKPGKFAAIAEVSEDWIGPVDERLEAIGGKVIRESVGDFVSDRLQKQADARKAELAQREAERASTKAEGAASRLEVKLEETRTKLQRTADKARDQLERAREDLDRKLAALEDQVTHATPDAKKRVQIRISELRREANEGQQKLNRAYELAQEALQG